MGSAPLLPVRRAEDRRLSHHLMRVRSSFHVRNLQKSTTQIPRPAREATGPRQAIPNRKAPNGNTKATTGSDWADTVSMCRLRVQVAVFCRAWVRNVVVAIHPLQFDVQRRQLLSLLLRSNEATPHQCHTSHTHKPQKPREPRTQ